MTIERVEPDFEEWAKTVLDRDELATALRLCYQQGWYAGYYQGQETSWQKIWDADTGFTKDGNKD